jgi:hypothetical protein
VAISCETLGLSRSWLVAIKRFLTLTSESLMSADEVVIELKQAAIGSFALELALLIEGLVQSVRIRPSRGVPLLLTLIRQRSGFEGCSRSRSRRHYEPRDWKESGRVPSGSPASRLP